jgi:hypothetical protein
MDTLPSSQATSASNWTLLRPYVLDIAGPFIGYFVAHTFGATGIWAMTAAGTIAALGTLINSVRRKGIDAVGLLVLAEIATAIVLTVYMRDSRLLLIRPSIYTAVASVFLIASAFSGRPLTFAGARTFAARGGEARLAAYDRTWHSSAEFRRTHFWVTFGFGLCLAVDSVLRVIIVYGTPVERAAWLSNVPHVTALVLFLIASALAGRRFSRLVEMEMAATRTLQVADGVGSTPAR